MRILLTISMIFAVTALTARAGVTYTITSYPGVDYEVRHVHV
jgi:hypothetical protein